MVHIVWEYLRVSGYIFYYLLDYGPALVSSLYIL